MDVQFETLADFFAMGGHALYVWLAYGSTVLVLLGNFLMLRGAAKQQRVRLRWSANLTGNADDDEPIQKDVPAVQAGDPEVK